MRVGAAIRFESMEGNLNGRRGRPTMVLIVRHIEREVIHVNGEEESRSFILEVHRGRGPQTVAIRHEGLLVEYVRMRQSHTICASRVYQ